MGKQNVFTSQEKKERRKIEKIFSLSTGCPNKFCERKRATRNANKKYVFCSKKSLFKAFFMNCKNVSGL